MIPALENLEFYAQAASSPEPDVLRKLRLETYRTRQLPQMIAGPLQGRLLTLLTKLSGAKRIVEVGTFVGYSALCFAEGLPKNGQVVTLDSDPDVRSIAQRYFSKVAYGRKIKLIMGPALKSLRALSGPFDLAYLDADKINYARYYEAILPKMLSGGLILADNLFWSGSVMDPKAQDIDTRALRAFAKKVRADKRVECCLLTVRDGLLLIRKR